ncbi:MAG: nucleotidyltransferase domain-containing protein [Cytophagaceae bacterium]|nr:nucleotidyltransferase domain-containing protein [Cytophagaceae bacterium]
MTQTQILDVLRNSKDELRQRFHVVKIGLFGSFARQQQTETSDLDLLVEFEENTENLYDVKTDLRVWVKQKLGLESDIAREKYLRPAARQHILNETIFV